jgi:predicted ester cyclase
MTRPADRRSPDLHTTFDDAVAEGERVAYRWTASGTHEGELMGIPTTGNTIKHSQKLESVVVVRTIAVCSEQTMVEKGE